MHYLRLAAIVPLLSQLVAAVTVVNTTGLQQLLSPGATISTNVTGDAPRWSDFEGPNAGAVVNVATEADVAATVRFCLQKEIPFLAQNGGHGWANTFTLQQNGLLINLAGLHAVTFSADRNTAVVQGGAKIAQVTAAGAAAGALIATGTCDCVGALGAILGGGVGNLMGLHGLGIDNLKALNVVTPTGQAITVTAEDEELWYAFRGAGANFGIVTSAVVISHPVDADGLNAWTGALIFADPQFEALIAAMGALTIEPEMAMSLTLVTSGAPDFTPTIVLTVFYYGTEAEGKAAFASIYAVGPVADQTGIVPYASWNAGFTAACTKGGFKPAWGAGLVQLVPETWSAVYAKFKTFAALPGAGYSTVVLDIYSTIKSSSTPSGDAAYPFRTSIKYNAIANAAYFDSSLDADAAAYGAGIRDLWRATSGISGNETYINNSHGDEPLDVVYGGSLAKLQAIKRAWDPKNLFNQWFPLSGPASRLRRHHY